MDILGIGPLELALIAIIILLVLGPKEMVSALRTMGQVLRKIVTSGWWQTTRQAIQDVRKLPYDLMREAGMEEDIKALDEIRQTAAGKPKPKSSQPARIKQEPDYTAWTQPVQDLEPGQATSIESADDEQVEPRILPHAGAISSVDEDHPATQGTAEWDPDNDQDK